jgi:hypothetical protein
VVSTLLECLGLKWKSKQVKDLEILLRRRQLAMLERQQIKPARFSRNEKLALVVLGT